MASLNRTIWFYGRVHPAGLQLDFSTSQNILGPEAEFSAKIDIKAVKSEVTVRCDFDNRSSDHPSKLWAASQDLTQGIANVFAFKLGAGAITLLDRWTDESGKIDGLALVDHALPPLCSSFSMDEAGFRRISPILFHEPTFRVALNDLIQSNIMGEHIPINCARAIESIRHLISGPNVKRKQAWPMLHKALNIDESYITLITDLSQGPRHGDHTLIGVRQEAGKE